MRNVTLFLLALACTSSPAAAKGVSLVKASCVHVKEGIVLPLVGFRYEAGKLRCTARLTVDKKAATTDVTLTVRLLQKPEGAGKEEQGRVAQKLGLWPGFKAEVEAELAVPDSLNGCMPFTLSVELTGQAKKVSARPTCHD